MFKRLISTTALVAAMAVGSIAAKADDIVIGIAGPMTGSLSAFGDQLRRGAELAVKDINAAGGVLGKQIKLEVGDDQGKPDQGPIIAHDLISKGVVFVAGHFQSGVSIPSSAVYADEGILMMTPASTNITLTDDAAAKGWKTIFRSCGRDDKQGVFAGGWLAKTYAGKKVAVLDDKSPYGKGLADQTVMNMQKNGLEPAMRETYNHGDQDFAALINKMAEAKIDAVYVGGYHDDEGLMLRQAREKGFNAPWVSGDALNSLDFGSIAGPASEGVRFSDASSAIDLDSAKEAVAKFRADKYEPEGYTLPSYAAVQAFAAAANGSNSTDGEKMAAWLRANTVKTVIGDLGWDDKGDLKEVSYSWFIWKDGKYAQEPMN